MNWKLFASALALAFVPVTAATVSGCAADAASIDDGEAEEAAASEEEINSAQQRLAGAFHAAGGTRVPTFVGLVFNADGSFFADVDTGIRCVRAPCPSHVRLAGRYSATQNYVRLIAAPDSDRPDFYGRYRYALTSGKLSLTRTGSTWNGWSNDLAKETSYCAEADDCWSQNLIHPMCLGGWVCGGGINNESSNQCGWKCGYEPPPPPSSDIWPTDATTLVAQTRGGGFTPPPPPGSNCAMGAVKYSLDVATKTLSYETCKFVDWQTPLTTEAGQKTLTAAEMASVNDAMNALTVTTQDICGADKPLLTVTVSSPSQGTKTFKDSFYACNGDGPYVDHIGGVFGAFRDAVGQ